MKKYLLILTFSLSAIYVFAQDFGTGVRFGLNYSTSSISDIFSSNDEELDTLASISGLSVGLIFDFKLNKSLSFQPEIRYSQSETDFAFDTSNQTETGLIFNKIEIPALLKLKVGTELLKLNLLAGPNLAFTTNAFMEERTTTPDDPADVIRTDVDISSNFEINGIAGFGLTIIFNDFALFADYRYNFKLREFNSVRQGGLINNLGSNIGGGFLFYY